MISRSYWTNRVKSFVCIYLLFFLSFVFRLLYFFSLLLTFSPLCAVPIFALLLYIFVFSLSFSLYLLYCEISYAHLYQPPSLSPHTHTSRTHIHTYIHTNSCMPRHFSNFSLPLSISSLSPCLLTTYLK